jgi:hypothetical protein
MNRRSALHLLCVLSVAAVSCDDAIECPAILLFDSFVLVFDDPEWTPANYTIEVSYRVAGVSRDYTCPVRVPAFPDESGDAGLTPRTDGGFAADGRPEYFSCTPESGTSLRYGEVGRAIVLRFNEAPARAHVVVRNGEAVVLDREITLEYATQNPPSPCQNALRATQRLSL